ncbi:MAG: hypothetical protein ACW987_18350 [Candidatus Thorarchaeota archaeon]
MPFKCYRAWFEDGSALLVDAQSFGEARQLASQLAEEQIPAQLAEEQIPEAPLDDPRLTIKSVECLAGDRFEVA